MSQRSRAREVALQVLYEDDLNPGRNPAAAGEFVRRRLQNRAELAELANSLISGVRRNRVELDELLSERAKNWSLSRMAATDRNALRIGAFELLYTETPAAVVINEAVDLARRFGDQKSSQFVNGLLDEINKSRPASS